MWLAELGTCLGKSLCTLAVEPRHRTRDFAHLGKLAATVKRDVATCGYHCGGPLGKRPAKRLHADIIAHHQAGQPNKLTNHFAYYNGRGACRSLIIEGGEQDMRRHGKRHVAERHEGPEIDLDQFFRRSIDTRKGQMAVGHRPPMAGNVLDHRQHATSERPLDDRAAEIDYHVRIEAEGAVTDDVVRSSFGHVEQGRAVDCDPSLTKLGGD